MKNRKSSIGRTIHIHCNITCSDDGWEVITANRFSDRVIIRVLFPLFQIKYITSALVPARRRFDRIFTLLYIDTPSHVCPIHITL